MIQKIKRTLMFIVTALLMTVPGTIPALGSIAFADTNNDIANNICTGSNANGKLNANQGVTCDTNSSGNVNIGGLAKTIINIFSIVVGAVAVIMIIYGGFRYITSGGSSEGVGNAKNTIIYAIIGLVIVALAQVIVHFVISTTTNAVGA